MTACAAGTIATNEISFGDSARATATLTRAERALQLGIKNRTHTNRLAARPDDPDSRGCCRTELRALGPHSAHPLTEAGPRPRLDLDVPKRGLGPRRLEVFEPGVGFLDQQQLLGFSSGDHGGMVGPAPDGIWCSAQEAPARAAASGMNCLQDADCEQVGGRRLAGGADARG